MMTRGDISLLWKSLILGFLRQTRTKFTKKRRKNKEGKKLTAQRQRKYLDMPIRIKAVTTQSQKQEKSILSLSFLFEVPKQFWNSPLVMPQRKAGSSPKETTPTSSQVYFPFTSFPFGLSSSKSLETVTNALALLEK